MVSFRKRGDLHGQSKENPRRSACGGNRRKRNYSGIDAAEEKWEIAMEESENH